MTVDIFVPSKRHHFEDVSYVDVDTVEGRFGILERHIDTAMALDVGLVYLRDADAREHFLGIDGGILIKTGTEVRISTGRVISGSELGEIEKTISSRQTAEEEREAQQLRSLARMELQLARSITGAGKEGA